MVVDKENGGKADALNAGLNVATGELVCAIDADTLIEPDALQRMVAAVPARRRLVAAGGTIRVVNGSRVKGGRVVRAARATRRSRASRPSSTCGPSCSDGWAGTGWAAT